MMLTYHEELKCPLCGRRQIHSVRKIYPRAVKIYCENGECEFNTGDCKDYSSAMQEFERIKEQTNLQNEEEKGAKEMKSTTGKVSETMTIYQDSQTKKKFYVFSADTDVEWAKGIVSKHTHYAKNSLVAIKCHEDDKAGLLYPFDKDKKKLPLVLTIYKDRVLANCGQSL